MHRVIREHVKSFNAMFDVSKDESKALEGFVNYSVFRSFSADSVLPTDLVYEGADPGIDGIMFFVDDKHVFSADEVDETITSRRKDYDVTVVFTQVKSSESWNKKEINSFQSAILDFLREDSEYPHSEYIAGRKEVFNAVVKHVGRLRGGKPRASAYFATTAREPIESEREILAAFRTLKTSIQDTDFFREVLAQPLDRNQLVELWTKADGPVEANLPVFAMAPFPKTPGIEESYVVTVRAADFVKKLLTDPNGKLRQRIFEENVRDYIGSDGGVNAEMGETLADVIKQKRFGILNNGVTLVSPDVRVQGNELYLRDFQIVNGCQTSNVLFEAAAAVSEDATLMLKVVETDDPSIVDDIVRSTNRQTKVQDEQFLATLDCVKEVERYFNARGADEEHKLYFERRRNQFSGQELPAIRQFDIQKVARCVGAMFFDKPDLSSRYPNRLTGELRDLVFQRKNMEDIYYTAAYSLYRLQILISNSRVDSKYTKMKWHLLMAIKYYIAGEGISSPTSEKIRKVCNEIDRFMSRTDEEFYNHMKFLCEEVADIRGVTRDTLRLQTFVHEVKSKSIAAHKTKNH